MRTPSLIFASVTALAAAACDPGSVDGSNSDELICTAELTLAGTFAIGTPQPAEVGGCWPIGTWTFTATVGTHDCAAAPTPLAQYQIRVDRDETSADPDFTWLYTYVTDPADATAHVGVSSGGAGLCEGEVLLFSADGKTKWNMHPALNADKSIGGSGEYEVHTTSQVPAGGE